MIFCRHNLIIIHEVEMTELNLNTKFDLKMIKYSLKYAFNGLPTISK